MVCRLVIEAGTYSERIEEKITEMIEYCSAEFV